MSISNSNSSLSSVSASALDAAFEKQLSRFVVGIDLGTTNCAVAFMDTERASPKLEIFRVEQMVDFQTSQRLDTLPSFHYELTSAEASEVDRRFQFEEAGHVAVVGAFARQRGMQMPGRCIASAKSWLCHPQVDRTSDMLPWSSDEDVELLSPVQASRRYLEHIRRMWDRDHPQAPLAEQDVVVTLPASFDEVARQLTIQAATLAGLPKVILIEEPQAAFYAWLHRNQDSWMQTVQPGQSILVCDIGGGTTDFTLIRVVPGAVSTDANDPLASSSESTKDLSQSVERKLQSTYGLHRVAVGEHLMLGGDNLDLALAHALERRILADSPGQDRLKPRQWDSLKAQCRSAKETLLGPSPPAHYKMSILGSGTKLIENTHAIEIDYEWVRELLVDGFFGRVALEERPAEVAEGFQEFGLPYAAEPNVHKHLAAFLWDHRWAGRDEADRERLSEREAAKPDWVLFNGGVLESSQVQQAVLDQIAHWFDDAAPDERSVGHWKPGVLGGNRLDLAVAQGAAYFGLVRRGQGIRIDARLARAYYLLVNEEPPQAMCVMPANAMPLDKHRLDDHPFQLMLGQPVQFPLLQSSTQLTHQVGSIVPVEQGTMTALPPIRTVLELGPRKHMASVPVVLEAELSEIGTLSMNLVMASDLSDANEAHSPAKGTSWKLEFDVRGGAAEMPAGQSEPAVVETVDSSLIDEVLLAMESAFGNAPTVPPKQGVAWVSDQMGLGRRDWSPSLLREMWRFLIDHQAYRKLSPEHESRWLNLLGWCLRPGFGVAADDWRVGVTWRSVHNKLMHRSAANVSETIVLWRRIAGGFTSGQQRALFQDVWGRIRSSIAGGQGGPAANANVVIEQLRLVGSLEWLTRDEKNLVGEQLLAGLKRKKIEGLHGSMLWALGRLGSRTPVYATLQQVLTAARVQGWIDGLLQMERDWVKKNRLPYSLCLMQLARRTDDRYRDVSLTHRQRVAEMLESIEAPELHLELVLNGGRLDQENADTIIGESLPLGFRLRSRV